MTHGNDRRAGYVLTGGPGAWEMRAPPGGCSFETGPPFDTGRPSDTEQIGRAHV